MLTKTCLRMLTSTGSMTMPPAASYPLASKHSSIRNPTGRRPGENTPSKVGYSLPPPSTIVAGACGSIKREQQGYQEWYFNTSPIGQSYSPTLSLPEHKTCQTPYKAACSATLATTPYRPSPTSIFFAQAATMQKVANNLQ